MIPISRRVTLMSKKTIQILILSLLCATSNLPAQQWSDSLASSQADAKTKGKMLFYYIHEKTSVDSRLIVKESFPKPDINLLFKKHFVLGRCDIRASSDFLPIVARLNLYEFKLPLIVLFAPDGRILSYHEGYLTPESLRVYLSEAAGTPSTSKLASTPVEELFKQGLRQYDAKQWDNAIRLFAQIDPAKLTEDQRFTFHFKQGVLYYLQKDYQAAIRSYKLASQLKPVPDVWYNMACSSAMEWDNSSAFFYLEKAFATGYKDFASLKTDADLKSLQGPELDKLIAKYDGSKPAQTKPAAPKVSEPNVTPQSEMTAMEKKCFDLVNNMRIEKGLKPLVPNSALLDVARKHSLDMGKRNYFDHRNPDGLSPFDRMQKAGISYMMAAENIQYSQGYADPAAVAADGWKKSPGHYRNIINSGLKESAIGVAVMSDGRVYFTQVFIQKP